jgi:hypothetical protein
VFYYDDDADASIECNLRRNTIAGNGGFDNVIAATQSMDNDQVDRSMIAPLITNAQIDNTTYYYFIQLGFNPGSDGFRRFYAAVIDYDAAVSSAAAPIQGFGRASAEPNPFASSTSIRFSMSASGPVTVDIYDSRGRRVRSIEEDRLGPGTHTLTWDGNDDAGRKTASGVYFAQVRGGNEALAAKLVRVR